MVKGSNFSRAKHIVILVTHFLKLWALKHFCRIGTYMNRISIFAVWCKAEKCWFIVGNFGESHVLMTGSLFQVSGNDMSSDTF